MLNHVSTFDYASPELSQSVAGQWRGHVDRFDVSSGIEGWALSIEAPASPVQLELVIGDDALAIAATHLLRPDLGGRIAASARPGFRFEPDVFVRLARLSAHRRSRPVTIRVAGTNLRLLSTTGKPPTVGELVDQWRTAILGRLHAPEPRVTKGDRLTARLALLRAEAETLRDLPLRPFSDKEIGQIDAVHLAAEGQVWFVGWMKRGVDLDFPAVVVDRQKYPAGVSILQYERQDLNTSLVGVIALMDTGWTPPAVSKDGFVYIGRNGQFHLRYSPQTRVLRADAFLAAFAQVQPVALGGHADAMASVLNSGSNWLPGNAAAAGIVAEGSVDRALMVPGFGCIVDGWAVSPAKRVETFHMKIGDCVLVADEASTYFRPRPDLCAVFPGGPSVTARAGFASVLRGALGATTTGAPLLRIVHDDGSMAVTKIEPKAARLADMVADSDEILRLYPSLRHEPFFPALVDAVRRNLAERSRKPQALVLTPASNAVVLRLQAEDNALRLTFDRIHRHIGDLAPGTGVALVADQGRGRSDAMLLFQELREASDAPLSLFSIGHGEDALDELPWLLSAIGAERFVHIGRGIVLTARGWRHAADSLGRRGHAIDRFEIIDDSGHPDRIHGALSAACFGWSTTALLGWSVSRPKFLRGVYGGSGLPETPGHDHVLPGAAMRIERPRSSRLADMIDDALLALNGTGRQSPHAD